MKRKGLLCGLGLLLMFLPGSAQDELPGWKEVVALDGWCVVKVPPSMGTVQQTTKISVGGVDLVMHMERYLGTAGQFGFGVLEITPDVRKRLGSPAKVIDALCGELTQELAARIVKDEKITHAKKHPGRQQVYIDKRDGETVHSRCFAIGDQVVELLAAAPPGQDIAKEFEKFCGTFRFVDKKEAPKRALAAQASALGLPEKIEEAAPEQLARALTAAKGTAVPNLLLDRLEAGKGGQYTQALADIIPEVVLTRREDARAVLARRLERMTVKTLTGYLEADNAELRLAAIRAAGAKGDAEIVPSLISIVADGRDETAKAAHAALEALTKKKVPLPAAPKSEDWQRLAEEWRKTSP